MVDIKLKENVLLLASASDSKISCNSSKADLT
jgi:hypothetical protein